MASAATSAVSFIDPAKSAKITVNLGQALRERQEPDRRFWSVKYNHKPRLDSTFTRKSRLSTGHPLSASLDDTDAAGNVKKYVFKGAEQAPSADTYSLIFDRQSKTFTLEPLAVSYALNITTDDTKTSGEDLLSKYGDATTESTVPAAVAMNGSDSHDDDGAEPPDHANPFDFRHYLSGLPNAVDGRAASTAGSPAASPLHKEQGVGLGITGGGSSPAPPNVSKPGTAASPTPHAIADRDRTAPKPLQQLSSPMIVPTISRKRKAPDIFSKGPRKLPPPKKRSPPATAGSTPSFNTNSKTAASASPEHAPGPAFSKPKATPSALSPSPPAAGGASDDLLVIENDESDVRGRPGQGSLSTPPGIRPRSLRDIATSRDVSPAAMQRPAATARGRGFLGRPRVDSGAASIRTDADVETDLDLGSPRWDGGNEKKSGGQEEVDEDDDDEIDVGGGDGPGEEDGEDDELSRAIQEAIEASDPEEKPDASQRAQADEEEESEEE